MIEEEQKHDLFHSVTLKIIDILMSSDPIFHQHSWEKPGERSASDPATRTSAE